MHTLTRRLAPHVRTAWLVLGSAVLLAVAVAVGAVLATGGGRFGVVAAVATGVVGFAVLAAFLDAILVPGNPDVRRHHTYGWSGAIGSGGAGGWSDGGGGGDGGSC